MSESKKHISNLNQSDWGDKLREFAFFIIGAILAFDIMFIIITITEIDDKNKRSDKNEK